MVIDPYGRIVAEGAANERGVIVGETFTVPGQTLYTRWGDWFGWLLVAMLVILIGVTQLAAPVKLGQPELRNFYYNQRIGFLKFSI